ncbi:hypothetical protein JXM67_08115 [candidate division WOR-3 bacterium]|nr:hypothetical protein [candidate division WOR-3 bacterium]
MRRLAIVGVQLAIGIDSVACTHPSMRRDKSNVEESLTDILKGSIDDESVDINLDLKGKPPKKSPQGTRLS